MCALSIKKNTAERTNLLYINQGNNKEGNRYFKEMAKEYNLADTGFSVQAAFFDYDQGWRSGYISCYYRAGSKKQQPV